MKRYQKNVLLGTIVGVGVIWLFASCQFSEGVASIRILGHEYALVWSQGQYQSTNGVVTNIPAAPYFIKR